MTDSEFAIEVVRDYIDEIRGYITRAMANKKIKRRHASNYTSKRGNTWYIIYSPQQGGLYGLHIKRLQPSHWFTWYTFIPTPAGVTLFGFNKHVAQRISERCAPHLTPSEALKDMLLKTPAIIQGEVGDQFYTRVNGGICIGSVFGHTIYLNSGRFDIAVEVRETKTFVSDELLYDEQKRVTDESILKAVNSLGINYLSDQDKKGHTQS